MVSKGREDSSFVDVEFKSTDGETYYYEIRDKQLEPGKQGFGAFEKFKCR